MNLDIERYIERSRALDLSDIDWNVVAAHPLPAAARRTLHYMQDIEGYTIMYLHELLSTRVVDDAEVTTFLACWLYEETFHGRALAQFLTAAGDTVSPTPRSRVTVSQRLEHAFTNLIGRVWPDFIAVHMTWGALNELTTLTGYRQLAARADHPVLSQILARIVRDESRHFHFYFDQAQQRLANPRTARIVRFLVDHFWAPVGAGVQPAAETKFLAAYLFGDTAGRSAARRVDETIRRLPGFADAQLLEAWIQRNCQAQAQGGQRRSPTTRVRAQVLANVDADRHGNGSHPRFAVPTPSFAGQRSRAATALREQCPPADQQYGRFSDSLRFDPSP